MLGMKRVCDLVGHLDRVWGLAWSPCGSLLASCGGDTTVRLWKETVDATMGSDGHATAWTTVHVLEGAHTGTIRSCCWSPDGRFLATASFDKTIVLWERMISDHDDRQEVWESVAVLEGHESEVKGVAWNPNGSLMATCGRDKTVWFWESQPGEDFDVVDVKHGHSQDVKAVCWHPHGEMLASVSYDDSIKLWMESEDSEWICVKTLASAHTSTVWDVSFDTQGRFMATCSDDRTIKIWRLTSSHGGMLYCCDCFFGHAFRLFLSMCRAESVDCTLVTTLSGLHSRPIYSVDILTTETCLYLVTGGGDDCIHVISFDPVTEEASVMVQQLHAHTQDVNCVRWRPCGSDGSNATARSQCTDTNGLSIGMFASAGDDGTVTMWDVSGTLG